MPLSTFHLVVSLGFHLVSASETYSSPILFCLTTHICGLYSSGCRTGVLASDVCPLADEVDPGACADFLVRGTGTYPLVGGVGSCPSGTQAVSRDVFIGRCWCRTTLSTLSADGRGCQLLGGARNLCKMVTSRRAHANECPTKSLPPVSLFPSEPQLIPASPGDHPRPRGMSAQAPMDLLLCPKTQYM